jgi:hypothetical protein
LAVVVALALFGASSSAAASTAAAARGDTSGRAYADRPDDFSGAQVHLVYAIPSDGTDRGLDTNGVIAGSWASAQTWLAAQTGGRRLRIDGSGGSPDISFVRLPETDSQIAGHGVYLRDELERLLTMAGFNAPLKLYEVVYDGSNSRACGDAAWPPVLPGHVVAVYPHGAPPGYAPCDTNRFATADEPAGYIEMDELHEVMHGIGFVPTCAPHHTRQGHASDFPTDLMYAGDQPWDTAHMQLDVGHDDYYQAHIPGCMDLSDSALLQGGHQLPPGWRAPTAPVISAAAVQPPTFKSGKPGRVTYSLSKSAHVAFTINRLVQGRKVKGKCVRMTSKNRKKRHCKLLVPVRYLTQVGNAGANAKSLPSSLSAGSYRVTLVATDSGNRRSAPRTLSFSVK